MFNKMNISGMQYQINKKKPFKSGDNFSGTFKGETIHKVFNFAYQMTFGGDGEHRHYRSGGTHTRKNGEIFANTFQGKLAECAVYNYACRAKMQATSPDFSVYGLKSWDFEDINIDGKSCSIKSTKSFGNLLLLETKDYDSLGTYLPNNKIIGPLESIL